MIEIKKILSSLETKKSTNFFNISRIIHKFKQHKFQHITIVDLLVFLLIFSIIGLFLYNRFFKKTIWVNARIMMNDPEVWWKGENPEYWLVDEIQEGSVAYNSFGEEIAVIENIEDISLGELNRLVYVDVKLKVIFDESKGIYLYNYRPIQKGKPIDLVFGKNSVSGLIYRINSDQQTEIKKVKVKVFAVDDFMVDNFKVGMTVLNSQGEVVAEVKKINSKEKSSKKPIDIVNNELFISNANYYDITMEVELQAIKDLAGYYRYVNGEELKLGAEVIFQFTELVALSKIIEFL